MVHLVCTRRLDADAERVEATDRFATRKNLVSINQRHEIVHVLAVKCSDRAGSNEDVGNAQKHVHNFVLIVI